MIKFHKRPLLVAGMVGWYQDGEHQRPMVLVNSELPRREQNITIWHEILHLMGMVDETVVEEMAVKLADTVDATEIVDYESY